MLRARHILCVAVWAGITLIAVRTNVEAQEPGTERGQRLYDKHCSVCHGPDGRGDGPAAYLLLPKPRDFGSGAFRLITTMNGVPSDDDLMRSITDGMTGSAMPPWERLPEADRKLLVGHVKKLWREGLRANYLADDTDPEEVEEFLKEDLTPGETVSFDGEGEPTPARIARGRIVYSQACAPCHGPEGRGRSTQKLVDSDGFPAPARDYTKGIFKGGSSARDLYARLRSGMKGTAMPRYSEGGLSKEEAWATVHYIRTLFPPAAQARQRQTTQRLSIFKVSSLPATDADWWKAAAPAYVPVVPLWWRDKRIEGMLFQAVHDGRTLAIRLTWEDGTEDLRNLTQRQFHDGAAVQLSWDKDPPFFGMGDSSAPVAIWSWKASWQEDQTAFYDLESHYPYMNIDHYPEHKSKHGERPKKSELAAPHHKKGYMTGWGSGNPVSNPKRPSVVEVIGAKGLGTVTTDEAGKQKVLGQGTWDRGTWSLVIRAELPAERCRELFIAFAVWNGSQQDRNGQKSVSIWHHLGME